MKATGIVRRIDDLGRVVIPKEIRRTLRIREGDPLEIFVDREGEVILKKYSPISELGHFATEYSEALYDSLHYPIIISDRDEVIALAGLSKKEYLNKQISSYIGEVIEDRVTVFEKDVEESKELVQLLGLGHKHQEGKDGYHVHPPEQIEQDGGRLGSDITKQESNDTGKGSKNEIWFLT